MPARRTAKNKPLALSIDDLGLSPDDEKYPQGVACVRTYWAQAVDLDAGQQKQMINHIKQHDYYFDQSLGEPITSHKLYYISMHGYQVAGETMIMWPIYLLLATVCTTLPKEYLDLVEQKFKTTTINDNSKRYFRLLGLDKNGQPKNDAEHAASSTRVTRSASSVSNMQRAPIATVPSSAPPVGMNDDKDAGGNLEVSDPVQRNAKKRRLPNDALQSSEDADSNRPQQSPTSKTNTDQVPIGIQRPFKIAKTNPPLTVAESYRPKSAACQCGHHAELLQLQEEDKLLRATLKELKTMVDIWDKRLQEETLRLNITTENFPCITDNEL
ncbi:hypothetical protein V8C35DRAFT_314677 [Trichoderma chlorosporum]